MTMLAPEMALDVDLNKIPECEADEATCGQPAAWRMVLSPCKDGYNICDAHRERSLVWEAVARIVHRQGITCEVHSCFVTIDWVHL